MPISDADTVFDTPGEPGAITARPWVCIDDDNWAVAWETVALLVPASSLSEEERLRLRRALVRASATITTLAVAPEALTLLSADMETSEDEILLPITVEQARSTLRTSADLNQRLTS